MWRVVIAEDEVLLTLTLREELEAYGVTVVGAARDGRKALRLCQELHPDAVLMDLRLPLMDGVEATRRIMADCPTRVIVVTAADTPEARAQAAAAGAAAFFAKPASVSALVEALCELHSSQPRQA